jgi:hypothetical protein
MNLVNAEDASERNLPPKSTSQNLVLPIAFRERVLLWRIGQQVILKANVPRLLTRHIGNNMTKIDMRQESIIL